MTDLLGVVNSLTETELALFREAEPENLAGLDEDGLLDVHNRIRRARNKHQKVYRRRAAARVGEIGARGRAFPRNTRRRAKAEVFEDALARVSEAVAAAARASVEALRAERLAEARQHRSAGPAAPTPGDPRGPAHRSEAGPSGPAEAAGLDPGRRCPPPSEEGQPLEAGVLPDALDLVGVAFVRGVDARAGREGPVRADAAGVHHDVGPATICGTGRKPAAHRQLGSSGGEPFRQSPTSADCPPAPCAGLRRTF
ncbi:hypothetical protein M1L60_40985 [Actinoplanes sp. TRM 88003]|uniref:Uncharacterized protein n=1 Tax=Paractinoplanes aksuensis TaxID=2939490 RepID=A0ABT1E2A3_9ACTN|nr:hypothetical protein [Actinoplanes aksuensis]MCO8276973.1 hypothetical protein [Actinoplanes aksuensis]